jgi:hypothetical protein
MRDFAAGVARDAQASLGLAEHASRAGAFLRRIPEFDRDIADLDGLAVMADLLVEAEAQWP